MNNITYELCPHCENEVAIDSTNKSKCPICNEEILPCSMCDMDVVDCDQCPFNIEDDSCDCVHQDTCAYKMKGNCSLENEGIECPEYEC